AGQHFSAVCKLVTETHPGSKYFAAQDTAYQRLKAHSKHRIYGTPLRRALIRIRLPRLAKLTASACVPARRSKTRQSPCLPSPSPHTSEIPARRYAWTGISESTSQRCRAG